MNIPNEIAAVIEQIRLLGGRVVDKESSTFMRFLYYLLLILSFGQFKTFMSFHTTIGKTVYLAKAWEQSSDLAKLEVLTHEAVHIRQFKSAWIFMMIAYIFLPIPIGLAYCRWMYEREAYLVGLKTLLKFGWGREQIPYYVDHVLSNLGGPAYFWCWPKAWMKSWFDEQVKSL
jgi:hypothetical protein